MKLVYRFEDKDGKGPYYFGSYIKEWQVEFNGTIETNETLGEAHGDMNHPTPYEEGIKFLYGRSIVDYICGFTSIEQFSNWFDSYWQSVLFKAGFKIVKYIVQDNNVIELQYQCCFIKPLTT